MPSSAPGSSCFMTEETFDLHPRILRARTRAWTRSAGGDPLAPPLQLEIARQVDWVYDFALPPLVLHAFFNGTAAHAEALDRHPPDQCADRARHARRHRRHRHRRGCARPGQAPGWCPTTASIASCSRSTPTAAATACAPRARRPRTLTCTRSTALSTTRWGATTCATCCAAAIQFFLPGIPQVYYVGLLAGTQRHGAAGTDAGRARHQPASLHPRRDRRGAGAAGRRRPAGADPAAQHASGIPGQLRAAAFHGRDA